MKKRTCLLLTLIVSIFVFSGRVEAAKELSCLCKDTRLLSPSHLLLVQNSEGELFVYLNGDYSASQISVDSAGWTGTFNGYEIDFDFDGTDKDTDDGLISCPNYYQGFETSSKGYNKDVYTFKFSDNKIWNKDDHACIQYNGLPDLDVHVTFYRDKIDEYNEIIENTEWTAKCTYYATNNSKKHLYFNEDRYILINESEQVYSSGAKFSLKQLWDVANSALGCPRKLYEKSVTNSNMKLFFKEYYLSNENSDIEYTNIECVGCENFKPKDTTVSDVDIKNCKDLFGDDLVKKIDDIMDIVKIVVPILLIAFGIVDFTKAVFSGSVDDMSKCQKKFLKRIVAAVLVFLAPIFINLLLSLANNVWEEISPDACIGEND